MHEEESFPYVSLAAVIIFWTLGTIFCTLFFVQLCCGIANEECRMTPAAYRKTHVV